MIATAEAFHVYPWFYGPKLALFGQTSTTLRSTVHSQVSNGFVGVRKASIRRKMCFGRGSADFDTVTSRETETSIAMFPADVKVMSL
jgi:hypothetical protein